jgi:phage gpG-like protein
MQISLIKTSDTLTPDLAAKYRALSDRTALHQAIGLGLVSLTKRAFNDSALRPAPWKSKADGTPSRLRDTGTLAKSVRVTAVTNSFVTIGSDRHYAAIHQLGGKTKAHIIRPRNKKALWWPGAAHPMGAVNHPGSKIPARPYMPFDKAGRPTALAVQMINRVVSAKLNAATA